MEPDRGVSREALKVVLLELFPEVITTTVDKSLTAYSEYRDLGLSDEQAKVNIKRVLSESMYVMIEDLEKAIGRLSS